MNQTIAIPSDRAFSPLSLIGFIQREARAFKAIRDSMRELDSDLDEAFNTALRDPELDSTLRQAGIALRLHSQGVMEVVPTIAANHQQSMFSESVTASEAAWFNGDSLNVRNLELEFLQRNNALFLGEYLTQSRAVHVKQAIIDIFNEGGDIAGDLEHLFKGIVDAPNNYFKTYTANMLNNARTYAQLSVFAETEAKYFEIVAVLDGRTTNICRALHGKTFPVAPALQNMKAFFEADNLDSIKEISPMVYGTIEDGFTVGYGDGASPLNIDDSNAMIRANVMSPPFHFNCRSSIKPVYA